jgi:small basic protein (TIGR04137 family)
MTMDRTLKSHGGVAGTRSVLSRTQRIARLIDEGKFDPAANSPLGLPKVRVKHSKAGTKTKKAAEEVSAAGIAPAEGAAAVEAEAAKGAAKTVTAKPQAPGAAKPQAPGAAKPQAPGAAKGQEKKK